MDSGQLRPILSKSWLVVTGTIWNGCQSIITGNHWDVKCIINLVKLFDVIMVFDHTYGKLIPSKMENKQQKNFYKLVTENGSRSS